MAMLEIRDLTIRFGGLMAIDRMNLDLPERGVFALIGPNGAGKTTLLNAITRLAPVASGSISFCGREVGQMRRHQLIELGIARSFQTAALFSGLTVRENVMVGLHRQIRGGFGAMLALPGARRAEAAARARADECLKGLDLWPFRDLQPGSLPHGYQKLLDVARALVSRPRLLLLDEPFAGVTRQEEPQLLNAILRAGEDCAVLMIEHDFELVASAAQRVTVMNFGRKIAEDSAAAIRRNPQVITCYLGGGTRTAGAGHA